MVLFPSSAGRRPQKTTGRMSASKICLFIPSDVALALVRDPFQSRFRAVVLQDPIFIKLNELRVTLAPYLIRRMRTLKWPSVRPHRIGNAADPLTRCRYVSLAIPRKLRA